MTAAELVEAERAITKLRLPAPKLRSRRLSAAPRGAIDPRATLCAARTLGGEVLILPKRAPRPKPPKVVVLISDGLDRGAGDQLGKVASRIKRSAREFIWMNPLLLFDGFEPLAKGVIALLPNVDRFMGAHNLDSFAELSACLSGER